jgi:flagella basal body P-ring formation protein FlgA
MPEYIIKTKEIIATTNWSQTSGCHESEIIKLQNIINQTEGRISSFYIAQNLENNFNHTNFEITPQFITILSLNSFIKSHFTIKDDLLIVEAKLLSQLDSITYNSNTEIKLECSNCDSIGKKNISLQIGNTKNWMSITLGREITTYVATSPITARTNSLQKNNFEESKVIITDDIKYLSTLEHIEFYTTNKSISKGSPVKTSDLSMLPLVKIGQTTSIEMEQNGIYLKSKAIPLRNGYYGETIEFKNPANNKIIIGKVIDFNTAQVEL